MNFDIPSFVVSVCLCAMGVACYFDGMGRLSSLVSVIYCVAMAWHVWDWGFSTCSLIKDRMFSTLHSISCCITV
jgi:hypothetical protein